MNERAEESEELERLRWLAKRLRRLLNHDE